MQLDRHLVRTKSLDSFFELDLLLIYIQTHLLLHFRRNLLGRDRTESLAALSGLDGHLYLTRFNLLA